MARPPARRFLLPGAGQGNGTGYTSQPVRPLPQVADEPEIVERIASATNISDEPEAPSRAWVNAEAELAAERNRLRLLARAQQARYDRESITIENRMLDAQRRAKLKHIDMSHEFHVMRKMFGRGNDTAATRRLETVEALLDGVLNMPDAA